MRVPQWCVSAWLTLYVFALYSLSVNDIVAVGVESFYATNDHSYPSAVLHMLAVFLGLPWADVVYYSPGGVKAVGDGFLSANGINMSPDKRCLLCFHNCSKVYTIENPTV